MKTLIFTLNLLLIMSPAFSQSLAGSYSGDISGIHASLQLKEASGQLTGKIDAQGYIYILQGTAQGPQSRGILTDPQTMATMNFEAVLKGENLTLTLIVENIYSGQTERTPFYFSKAKGQSQALPQVLGQSTTPKKNPTALCKECDQQIVGAWIYTKTYFSGDFSSTTQLKMRILPNGTYAYGNARVMAGGSNDYDHIHADTGGSDEVTHGKWKTKNSIIYVKEEGNSNWYAYAKYEVSGASLLLMYEDGSRELWERN